MSTYTDLNYIEKYFTSANGISLSFVDLMKDLRLMVDGGHYYTYLEPTDEDGNEIELSEDQQLINDRISKIKSFNAIVYAVVKRRNEEAHKTVTFEINDHNYKHLKVNNYYMDEPEYKDNEDEVIPEDYILKNINSVYFNNTKSLDIQIDSKFPVLDAKGNVIINEDNSIQFSEIKSGDYFYIYIVVGTIDTPAGVSINTSKNKNPGALAELYYKFIYKPAEISEENLDDNSDAENEWVIQPDVDEDSYPIGYKYYYLSDERWSDYIFLNTVSVTELRTLPNQTLVVYDPIVRVFISPLCPVKFTFQLTVSTSKKDKLYTFNYVPKTLNVTKPHLRRAIKMNNPDVSYALLRTNPKLTGNVKVVIDEKSNIYLDTFKVSDVLSHRKYRHIKVGSDSYYGTTLVKYFKDMPTTEFYKIENKCYNLFSTVQSYKEQYYDVYRYGVKTNDDNMYSENYALLAPLCIKRVIPDFFLVFRVDKNSNEYSEELSDDEKINYFLSKGVLIKSYDMRLNSPLGTYVRNIYKHTNNEPGDMYISYSTDNLNKFVGISLDKGVVASMYESPYNDINIKNQVALNDFYTGGFERNHIVSKNIVNFEFMFNDPDVEAFSMNTYFGIYVKVNEQEESFSCIGYNDNEYTFDTSVYTFPYNSVDLSATRLRSIIYGLTTPKEFIRYNFGITRKVGNETMSNYMLKPYKNLLTTKVNTINLKDIKSFITINVHKRLEVGEHYRIIDTLNDIIYEVILCDINNKDITQGFNAEQHNLSEVITNYYNEFGNTFTIKRLGMYIHYKDYVYEDKTDNEIIAEQVEQLYYAFRKLGDENIRSYQYNNNSLSLVSDIEGTLFEKICAPSGFDKTLKKYVYETADETDSLTFFGGIAAHKIILDLDSIDNTVTNTPLWQTKSYAYLYPIHFEIVGSRIAFAMGFKMLNEIGDGISIYEGEISEKSKDIFTTRTILYFTTNEDEYADKNNVDIYNKMDVNIFVNDKDIKSLYLTKQPISYLQSFNDLSKYIVNVKDPLLQNKHLSLYSSYPLNSGVCSIFNIKDFDFEVLDNISNINAMNFIDTLGSPGEYRKESIFTQRPYNVEEIIDLPTEDDINGTVEWRTNTVLKWGSPIYRDINTNHYDQILTYNEDKYVVKHYTLEKYKQSIIEHLIALYNTNPNIENVYKNSNSIIYTISDSNLTLLKKTLGIEFSEDDDYIGIVLRPFLTGSIVYDKANEDFNKLVSISLGENISEDSFFNIIGVDESGDSEENVYYWKGLVYFINNLNTDVFKAEELLIDLDFDNPEVVYEDDDELNKICENKPIVKTGTSEECFLNYIDKFEKYDSSTLLLVSSLNKNTNRTNYLKTLFKDNHNRFDISLTCPYVCKWKSIGTDARIGNLRLMYDYNSLDNNNMSYYIPDGNKFDSYLGILYLKDKNQHIPAEYQSKYINRSFDDVLFKNTKSLGIYEKDYILNENGALDDILYDVKSQSNKFSIAYKVGDKSLEFISGGIKFRIKSNNNDIIDFSKYQNYSAAFISLPIKNMTSSKNLELIIDETRNEILLIWYCYTNSLEYGVKMRLSTNNDLDNNVELFSGLTASKINYTKSIRDIKYKPIITTYGTYKAMQIEDTMHLGDIVDKNTKDSEYIETSGENKFTRHGAKLCHYKGYVFISNMGVDETSYTSTNVEIVTGIFYNNAPLIDKINQTYPYYNDKGYLTPISGFIWHQDKDAQYNYHEEFSDAGIELYSNNLGTIRDSLLYVDDIRCIPSSIRNLDDLKEVLDDCGIFIKTNNGKYDYSTLEGLLSLQIIDPIKFDKYTSYKRDLIDTNKLIKDNDDYSHVVMHTDIGEHKMEILNDSSEYSSGYVHSTYAEPVTKDMLNFYFSSLEYNGNFNEDQSEEEYVEVGSDLETVFQQSFDGANIYIKTTNNIDQLWINKCTEHSNYCMIGTNKNIKSMLFPIDHINNVSIMDDCTVNTEFRKYTILDNSDFAKSDSNPEDNIFEEVEPVKGYTIGGEVKMFLNSKALSLNTDKIVLESWKNTEINLTEKYIKLNITDSLIAYIMNLPAYYKMWKDISLKNDTYKTLYIKNYILNFININNKTKFELKHGPNKTKKLRCSNTYNKAMISYQNFKNELKYENSKYYMYIYVDDFYTYYPKITITL